MGEPVTALTDRLRAAQIIANNNPHTPVAHVLPRSKRDVRVFAANARADAAADVVRLLMVRVAEEIDEGRRT